MLFITFQIKMYYNTHITCLSERRFYYHERNFIHYGIFIIIIIIFFLNVIVKFHKRKDRFIIAFSNAPETHLIHIITQRYDIIDNQLFLKLMDRKEHTQLTAN